MRILYVGTEPTEAQAIATAVSSLAEGVTVSCTSSLDRVASWIDEKDGLGVLVVEANPNVPVWRSVLTYAAGLPHALPSVVIVPEDIAPGLQPPASDAYECLARNASVLGDLPAAITRAIDRSRQRQVERSERADLERKLAQATSAADQLAKLQSQYEMDMARAAATRDMVNEQFREAAREVERVRLRHAAAVADAERLAEREADLERRASDAETALQELQAKAAEERRTFANLISDRRGDFDRKISEEIDKRREVEVTLAHALKERTAAKQRHASAMSAVAVQFRELQAALNAVRHELESKTVRLEAITTSKDTAEAALKQAAESNAELEEQVRKERLARARLEQEIADADAALADTRREQQSAAAEVTRLTEREAHLEEQLTEARAEIAAQRAEHASQVRQLEEARDHARQEHESAVADVARLTEREANLERQLADVRAEIESQRADHSSQVRELEEARDHARRQHEAAIADLTRLTERESSLEDQLKKDEARHTATLAAAAAHLADREAHFERELADIESKCAHQATQLRELEEARDRAQREHASALEEVARLAEREARLQDQLKEEQEQHRAALAAAAAHLADREAQFERGRAEIETKCTDYASQLRAMEEARDRVRREHESAAAELMRMTDYADRLAREHATVLGARDNDIERLRISVATGLHELENARTDNHRLFQQAPLPMFRCTKDGALTHANRMLMNLVGRRSPAELRGPDWAAAVFESPDDLSWLIERCLGSKGKESIETAWRRNDRSRLLVRVTACVNSSNVIEASVEDLTPIRVLNDRLSQAHRMEAVGRLATEVAVTCGNLLSGVHQNIRHLLINDDPSSRQRAEMLIDDITRAAGLLRQFAAYGDEERRKPAVVELTTVIRDVAPILKRIAGEAVEVEVSDASTPLNVDAGPERVQRLLVNLAAYARERMPMGGRLKIELGKTVVDRHFAARHPNVRLGPHALITVTESRRATPTNGSVPVLDNETGSSSPQVAVQHVVDLATVQELVSECGGHLWMTVEAAGDMVVKIRLPLVTSYGEPPRRPLTGGRVRALTHWFQH